MSYENVGKTPGPARLSKGASKKTNSNTSARRFWRAAHWKAKMEAVEPPPWKQEIRARGDIFSGLRWDGSGF